MVDTIGRVWSGGDLLLVEHSPACPFGQAFVVMFYDSDELLTTRFGCLKFRRQISWQPHRVPVWASVARISEYPRWATSPRRAMPRPYRQRQGRSAGRPPRSGSVGSAGDQ